MTATYEELLTLFQEVAVAQRELTTTQREMAVARALDRQKSEQEWQELRQMFRETDLKFQATDLKFQATDLKFRETDERIQAMERSVKELSRTFGSWHNRLGEFVEEMVRPAVIRLFRQRGLEVHQVTRDLSAINLQDKEGIEIDLLVTNATIAIAVECKSRLTVEDVQEHLSRLDKFKRLFPKYANYQLLGAVAAMVLPDEIARFAYRQRLFVLAQSGDGVLICNDARFIPKQW